MSATYRIVYYTRPPVIGARHPLGAIVRTADGRLAVARATHLPSTECLGSRSAALSVRMLADGLDEITAFDALPSLFGASTILGEPEPVPGEVADPVAWVERVMNPPRAHTPLDPHSLGAPRRRTR